MKLLILFNEKYLILIFQSAVHIAVMIITPSYLGVHIAVFGKPHKRHSGWRATELCLSA
jgi:hypothetical protein